MRSKRPSRTAVSGMLLAVVVLSFPRFCTSQEDPDPVAGATSETQAGECADLSVLSRLPGSVIVSCNKGDSVEVTMPLEPDARGNAQEKSVRGAFESREYQVSQANESESVFDGLTRLLGISGFTVKYSESPSTITARNDNTWILVHVNGESYDVDVVRTNQERWTPVTNVEGISREMETRKRVAIYGVQFSTDNQTVIEANSLILGDVLTYLQKNTGVQVNVESHKMSNDKTPEDDLEITTLRAEAVVKCLEAHGVAAERLHAEGLGRSKPLTDNDTPSEIQRNERIEIVAE